MRGGPRRDNRSPSGGHPTSIAVTVDHRGGERFGPNFERALGYLHWLRSLRFDAALLNVNQPLVTLKREIGARTVFVVADTFAPGVEGARRSQGPHGVRRWLQQQGIAFIGSTASAMRRASSGDKIKARRALMRFAVVVPRGIHLPPGHRFSPDAVGRRMGWPVVVKCAVGTGVGVGVYLTRSAAELGECVRWEWNRTGGGVVVEEYVRGREFTVWIGDSRGAPSPLAVLEIRKPAGTPLFNQDAKIHCRVLRRPPAGTARVPAVIVRPALSSGERKRIEGAALAAHRACGLRHVSRIDLIARGGRAWVLDVNAAPEIRDRALHRALAERGTSVRTFLTALCAEARA